MAKYARYEVRDGKAVTQGDFAIAGVAGTAALIRLDFLDPGGTVTRGLLPTGNVVDGITVDASTVSASWRSRCSLPDRRNSAESDVRPARCGRRNPGRQSVQRLFRRVRVQWAAVVPE